MKILDVTTSRELEAVKLIRFARFCDQRGYFTEHYRKSDFATHPELGFLKDVTFVQCNESYSRKGTVRGLHFQWNPYMGKLVRTVSGRMVDMVLDIRLGSPTFGKIAMFDMPSKSDTDRGEWIWVPPGFAHGNYFLEPTVIEYFCSGQYSAGCEAGISPLSSDLDWSLCNQDLKRQFDEILADALLITDKDRNGFSLRKWEESANSKQFVYDELS